MSALIVAFTRSWRCVASCRLGHLRYILEHALDRGVARHLLQQLALLLLLASGLRGLLSG